MSWVSPTGHTEGDWTNEANAYDGNTGTYASLAGGGTWTAYIILDLSGREPSSIQCSKVRLWYTSSYPGEAITADVDVYYDSGWHDVWQGVITSSQGQWLEKSLPEGTKTVSQIRLRFTQSYPPAEHRLYEVDFWEIESAVSPLVNGGPVR
jgi:hypothetical protein